MKLRLNYLFLILISIAVSVSAQTQSLKTIKKISAAKSTVNKTGNTDVMEKVSRAGQNLRSFMKKVGISPSITLSKAAPGFNSTAAAIKNGIALPDFNSASNDINKIIVDKESGTARLIEIKTSTKASGASPLSFYSPMEKAINFLTAKKELLKISEPAEEFVLASEQKDQLGMKHLRFSQTYRGLEVWGKEIYVHFDRNDNLTLINGRYGATPVSVTDINERFSSEQAVSEAINDLKKRNIYSPVPEGLKKYIDYKESSSKKIIWIDNFNKPHLVWHVEVMAGLSQHWYYFIDARSGEILNKYNRVCYDGPIVSSGIDLNGANRTFGTYQGDQSYYMIDITQPMFNNAQSKLPDEPAGAIFTLDLNNSDLSNQSQFFHVTSSDNLWSVPSSVSAHYNATITYNYFRTVHGRNSIDDKGGTIYSLINVTESGQPMENAFWALGKFMCYGNGGTYFKPLAGALDVSAHEMTHGVIEYSAGLEYQDQAGALNESFADVFGVVVDSLNWTLAEDIVLDLNTFPAGAMRNMADPHNGGSPGSSAWQPSKMSEFVNTREDHGGVHINSGIPNHAFYIAATSIGRAKAAQIWYRALTNYLTRTSQFIDARIATVRAAVDIYGETSNEVTAVKAAWDGVEVFEGGATPPPPPTSVIGDDWILVANTNPSDPNSLYLLKSSISSDADIMPISATGVFNRPSVTDATGLIVFIDAENNLRAMYADPNNPQEEILDDSGFWWSVAVGPGLSSIALTTAYSDTSIYYFDLANNEGYKVKIAIQSHDGSAVTTALYADALSFDPTGQYVLFDAYNEVYNSSGDTLSYWNINLLEVTTGKMSSVFPPTAESVSIGNPSFSKTSPSRFTFDYIDASTNEYYVLAVDFNTGNVGTVAGPHNTVGYPTYSGDDRAIAFHTIVVGGEYAGREAIFKAELNESYIEGTGNVSPYFLDATFPAWFVIGTRTTDVEEDENSLPDTHLLYQNYPNPFNPSTKIKFQLPFSGPVSLKVYDILGKEVAVLLNEDKPAGNYEVTFDASGLSSGVYIYTLRNGEFRESRRMILMK